MSLLKIEKLTKNFGGLRAIDTLDWEVQSGKIVGLIGPNGAGKTTLFNMINGFIRPDEGKIEWNGESLVGLRPDRIARKGIGTVFQRTRLFRGKNSFESILVGCQREQKAGFWQALFNTASYQREEESTREKALDTLELLKLSKWRDNPVETLPFGTQRLLAIAQALMTKPQLLLLDEPFTGLNEGELLELLNTVREIRNQGITIVLIEHHMKGVMSICEQIMVLNYGKKIAEGIPEDIAKDPMVIEAYLGGTTDAV